MLFYLFYLQGFPKSPYLCNVFFIVLDFKVNKGWSTAVLLFLCLYVSSCLLDWRTYEMID